MNKETTNSSRERNGLTPGTKLALLLFHEMGDGKKDEITVHSGIVRDDASTLSLEQRNGNRVWLDPDWIGRLRPTPDAMRETLNDSDFFISLTVGPLPDDEDAAEYQQIGLNVANLFSGDNSENSDSAAR